MVKLCLNNLFYKAKMLYTKIDYTTYISLLYEKYKFIFKKMFIHFFVIYIIYFVVRHGYHQPLNEFLIVYLNHVG